MTTNNHISSGGVVFRYSQSKKIEVALLFDKDGKAHFPKGHVEENEGYISAARREISEEAGLINLKYLGFAGSHIYSYEENGTNIKKAFYWAFISLGNYLQSGDDEINSTAKWVPLDEAGDFLKFNEDKDHLVQATNLISINNPKCLFANEELIDRHTNFLQECILGLIFCGGILKSRDLGESDDIDYILVIQDLTPENLKVLANIRDELSRRFNVDFSNTVITLEDIKKFKERFNKIDPKATQALLEAKDITSMIVYSNNMPKIAGLSTKEIKDFSKNNYWQLFNLLKKIMIRSSHLSESEIRKIYKITLIAMKMEAQYSFPYLLSSNISQKNIYDHLCDTKKDLYKKLEEAKRKAQRIDDSKMIKIILEYFEKNTFQ